MSDRREILSGLVSVVRRAWSVQLVVWLLGAVACTSSARQQADAAFEQQAYREAAAAYAPLWTDSSADRELLRRYALSLARSGDAQQAEPLLRRLTGEASGAEEWAALVDVVAYQHGPERGLEALAAVPSAYRETPEVLRAEGTLAGQRGDVAQAEEKLKQALERQPTLAAAHAALGDLALREGQLKNALEHYQQSLSHDGRSPMSVRVRLRVARILAGSGSSEAVTVLQEAAAIEPTNGEVLAELGKVMAELQLFESAIDYLKQAIEQQVDRSDVLSTLGFCYLQRAFLNPDAVTRQQDVLASRMWLERLLKKEPTYRGAHINLAMTWLVQTDYENAEAALRQELTLYPTSTEAMANLGRLYMQQGRPDDAKRLLLRAFEVDRRQVAVAGELGAIFMQAQEFNEALAWYRTAYGLCQEAPFEHPCRAEVPFQLARLAARQRDRAAAVQLFLEAVGAGFRDLARYKAEPELRLIDDDPQVASLLVRAR